MSKQIVFIDSTVNDQHVLLRGIAPTIKVVHLIGTQDGLRQIADHMTERWEIDAVHIISHGASGMLQLGSASINRTNLKDYFIELAHVGRAMREGGDILFYGCEVAAGEPGAALIEGIAKLTGANVAASTLPVGHSNLGGTWDLNFQTGNVNAIVPFDQKARADFRQVLPVEPDHLVNTTTDGIQRNQQIVTLSTGGYAIVWNSELTAQAFFQLYDTSGNTIGSETLVGNGGFIVHALALNNGNFMVAYGGQVTVFDSGGTTLGASSFNTGGDWEKFVPASNNGFAAVYSTSQLGDPARDIVVQLFGDTGDQVLGPVMVNQTTIGGQIEPVIARIPNTNEFFVVSETIAADGSRSIHAQRLDDAGQLVGQEITVLSPENLPLSRDLRIATTSDGRIVVGYVNQYTGELDGKIYEADGTLVSDFHFGNFGDFNIAKELLTPLAGGGFVVTADGITDNGDYFVKAGIYDNNGTLIGSTFDANSVTLSSPSQHSATALSLGGFVVTWTTNAEVGAGNALYGQQFDATGNKVGDQFSINSTTNIETTYSLIALPNDGFAVTWNSQGDVYEKTNFDLIAFNAPIADADRTVTFSEDLGYDHLPINLPTDPNGDPLTITVTDVPNSAVGSVYILDANNERAVVTIGMELTLIEFSTLAFRPEANQNGAAGVFSYIVMDDQSNSDSQVVTIEVGAVNDAPEITSNGGANLALTYAESSVAPVTTIVATDIDNASTELTYSLSGADAARFTINAGGELTFKAQPDYEVPVDVNGDNIYDVNVTVSDGVGGTDVQSVAITVTNSFDADVDKTLTLNEDSGDTALAINAPVDPSGNSVTIMVTSVPNGAIGSVFVAGSSTPLAIGDALSAAQLTSLIFRPEADQNDFAGNFSYSVSNGQGISDTQTIAIEVTPVNDAPVITSHGGDNLVLNYSENSVASITPITWTDIDSFDHSIEDYVTV